MSLGSTESNAPVPPVSVPAILSALVAISTLPATSVEAFGCVLPDDTVTQAPPCLA